MAVVPSRGTGITPAEILDFYFDNNFRLVFWPHVGDNKGPRETGWTEKIYRREDYVDGHRVGFMCGHEIAPGRYLHDVDIDWADGAPIALAILPPTEFMYGRASKRISHCVFTAPQAVPSRKYEDPIDKSTLIELRGVKEGGSLGYQSMAPPSVWSKDGVQERLEFVRMRPPAHVDAEPLARAVCLSAIAMLFAKHFGKHGFGHEARLAWAGLLLRARVSVEECVTIGHAIISYTGNHDTQDIRLVIDTTSKRIKQKDKKVKGGPALAKIMGRVGDAIVAEVKGWLDAENDSDDAIFADAVDPATVDVVWARVVERNTPETLFRRQQKIVMPVAQGIRSNLDQLFQQQLQLRLDQEAQERDGAQFVEISLELFTEIVARCVPFFRYAGRGDDRSKVPAYPHPRLIKQLMASPVCPLPVGKGIIRTPSFDAHGTLLTTPGYHPPSGLYYVPPHGFVLPDLPAAPTADDIGQSLDLWHEVFGEFPFDDAASHAHLLALGLTILAREMIRGPVPMCLVTKPATGTGASLALQCIGEIVLGEPLPESTWSHDAEEQRKYLTTVLMFGRPLINLDNITYLHSKDLLSVLSGGVREDRQLGGNDLLSIPNRSCFVGSGNNPTYDEEHAGRLYVVRMDAKVENPRLRDKAFKHPNLKEWTIAHRPALVGALLTLVQAWIAAGRPEYVGKRLAGFEAWSNTVGGILQHAGVPGFLANRDQVMQNAQRSRDDDTEFVTAWWTCANTDPDLCGDVKTKDLLEKLASAIPTPKGSNQPTTISLGRYLERNVDRVQTLDDGTAVAIRRAKPDANKHQQRWRLEMLRKGQSDLVDVAAVRRDAVADDDNDDHPF